MTRAPFVPVIPAGGAGTRLWPLSRREHPKFLLDLTGSGASLLQQTVERLAPLADRPPLVVTGTAHAAAVGAQLGDRARVLTEPAPRNSMPAIALAAAVAEREDADAIIGSFAADHLIADADSFHQCVRTAQQAAADGSLVTLGIVPTHPATGFGYIRCAGGDTGVMPQAQEALAVAEFVEKPERERAEAFLDAGDCFWNAGMFVARAGSLLDALAEQIPPLADGARHIAAARGTGQEQAVLEDVWPTLTAIAIDHALAEPLAAQGRVKVVPARFDWDDVGDFRALAAQLRAEGSRARRVAVEGGEVICLGDASVRGCRAQATVYGSSDRLVAVVGVQGVSVVDTPDALLVLADDHAQDLSHLVASLTGTEHESLR